MNLWMRRYAASKHKLVILFLFLFVIATGKFREISSSCERHSAKLVPPVQNNQYPSEAKGLSSSTEEGYQYNMLRSHRPLDSRYLDYRLREEYSSFTSSPSCFRSGGLECDFRWSSLTGSQCPRMERLTIMHVVYAFEEYSKEGQLLQLHRLVASLHSLFHIGCGSDENKRRVQVHIFFQGFDIETLERAVGYLILNGLQIMFYPTQFEKHVVQRREVWGYGEATTHDKSLQKLKLAANFFRFYLASVMKSLHDAESFLYLDTDTVFIGSGVDKLFVRPLPLASFGQQELTSCTTGKMLLLDDQRLEKYGFSSTDPCLTASVMLVNTTLWNDQNITSHLEDLIISNANSKLWHLGSMPPLMIALHGRWTFLGDKILDGKGSDCSWLDRHKSTKIIMHPFKTPCYTSENSQPQICVFGDHTSSAPGSERIKFAHTLALARLVEGKFSINPKDSSPCDVLVNPSNKTSSTKSRAPQRVLQFKPNNLESGREEIADFIVADNEYMDQTWQLKSKNTVRLQLVEDFNANYSHTPRSTDFTRAEPANLCYHGNSMHIHSLVPKLANISVPFRLKIITARAQLKTTFAKVRDAFISMGYTEDQIISIAYDPKTIWSNLLDCDIGLAPVEVKSELTSEKLSSVTREHFVAEDTQDEDVVRRCKRTSNAGRAFVFMQLGIPVVTDACPEAILFSVEGAQDLALTAFRPEMWYLLLSRLLQNPSERELISTRTKLYAKKILTTKRQAAILLDKLSCHA